MLTTLVLDWEAEVELKTKLIKQLGSEISRTTLLLGSVALSAARLRFTTTTESLKLTLAVGPVLVVSDVIDTIEGLP